MEDVRQKSWKALAVLVGVVALVASSATVVVANSFTDVASGSFFEGPIDDITDAGCARGFDDGTFHPGDPATRGQFALWGANCFSRSTRATDPNVAGLSINYQDIDVPTIDVPGFAGEFQYLLVNSWYTLDEAGTECPCDIQIQVVLNDTSSGAVVDTSQEIIKVVEVGSGGDIDDTIVGAFRFTVPADNQYTIHVQGRLFGSTSGCTGNCLTLSDSETIAWTAPLDPTSAGVESGAESGVTSEDAEAVNNAVLHPSGNPNG